MRTLPLLTGLMLATTAALLALAPTGAALNGCIAIKGPCPGLACYDVDRDGYLEELECVPGELPGRCEFQSDCCDRIGSVWCPEYPPE